MFCVSFVKIEIHIPVYRSIYLTADAFHEKSVVIIFSVKRALMLSSRQTDMAARVRS